MSVVINDLPAEADAIYQAIKSDPYTRGNADYSVTEIIAPPRQIILKRRHENEITELASERIFALVGQSIHSILERSNKHGTSERRLTIDVLGKRISGAMDLYLEGNGTLLDYKTTSSYSVKAGGKDEWEKQLNVYAHILRANEQPVNALKVVAILRDWSKMEAKREQSYPQKQVAVVDIPLWAPERVQAFIESRVKALIEAEKNLPECSAEDRWARQDVWAVHKFGRKTAIKLHESGTNAQNHLAMLGKDHFVEHRKGQSIRCENYCAVAPFCEQYKKQKEKKHEW